MLGWVITSRRFEGTYRLYLQGYESSVETSRTSSLTRRRQKPIRRGSSTLSPWQPQIAILMLLRIYVFFIILSYLLCFILMRDRFAMEE